MKEKTIARNFALSIATLIGALTLVAIIGFTTQTAKSRSVSADQTAADIRAELYRLAIVADVLIAQQVKSAMNLLQRDATSIGTPVQGNLVTVNGRDVPDLLFGLNGQANNFSLVDGLTEIMGGTATIFSRSGDDFIRITTNVINNGQRAIGTELAPNGAAIKAIRNGEAFYGLVDILGQPYLTGYEPVRDHNNQVIGIWYVGYKADISALEDVIKNERILDSGFIVLRDNKGQIRSHSGHIDTKQAEGVLNNSLPGWRVEKTSIDRWGYEIISAFPQSELTDQIISDILNIVTVVLINALLLIGAILWLVRRIVSRPLSRTITRMKDIAEGDFTVRLDSSSKDELGHLALEFNRMLERLQTTLLEISAGASQLASASEELSSISIDSNKAIALQTSETEQVATAMNQMSATVAEVAKSTELAAAAAYDAQQEAKEGRSVVADTISSIESLASDVEHAATVINALSVASGDISQVLDVIKNIAEQTNLLALNAAIESARAGEHGRGFAVVADEVRSLASRTQRSTEEIHAMILRIQTESTKAVQVMENGRTTAEQSVAKAQSSRQSLQRIQNAVERINGLNTEVASTAEEQSVVAEEISRNITNIRDAAEHNCLNSEHSMRQSEELASLANTLQQRIQFFKV